MRQTKKLEHLAHQTPLSLRRLRRMRQVTLYASRLQIPSSMSRRSWVVFVMVSAGPCCRIEYTLPFFSAKAHFLRGDRAHISPSNNTKNSSHSAFNHNEFPHTKVCARGPSSWKQDKLHSRSWKRRKTGIHNTGTGSPTCIDPKSCRWR